jgi:hypothetical protein
VDLFQSASYSVAMAQVCGGTTFDLAFRRKHDTAQKMLSRAADIWAANGRKALCADSVIAVMLRIFLSKWSEWGVYPSELRQEARTFENWLSIVDTAQQEAHGLSKVAPSIISDALLLLLAEISCAADQWSLGNPEQPSTAEALNAIEHILFSHKLTHRPASPKLPITVRTASN